MLNYFFTDFLQRADSRITPPKQSARLLLDKNEQTSDVADAFKKQVLDNLLQADWNRYPGADLKDLETSVAQYCGLAQENIVLGPGSAGIITTLLNYFALNNNHLIISQPSYSLFDYHCKTHNISYQEWRLTADLEYDYDQIPELRAGSVLIITSPNNPVGNSFELDKLEQILRAHPDTYVLLDAVYTEFGNVDATPLVNKYPNLMVLRSFSKAFPVAGLRLGYLCAAPQTAAVIRKLVLQFSLNHFTLMFAREMFRMPEFMEAAKKQVQAIIAERDRLYRYLNNRYDRQVLQVFPSEGNFLLVRVFNSKAFETLMEDFSGHGIKVLNTSLCPLLNNTFRVSIGLPHENEAFCDQLNASLEKSLQPVPETGGVSCAYAVRPSQSVPAPIEAAMPA